MVNNFFKVITSGTQVLAMSGVVYIVGMRTLGQVGHVQTPIDVDLHLQDASV